MPVKIALRINSDDVQGLDYTPGSYYVRTKNGSEIVIDEVLISRLLAVREALEKFEVENDS